MRPSNKSINRASVRHFVDLIKRFFKGRETLDAMVPSIHKASVRPFGGMTIRFLRVMRLLAEEYRASDVQRFFVLET
jgi:hypothetical protein